MRVPGQPPRAKAIVSNFERIAVTTPVWGVWHPMEFQANSWHRFVESLILGTRRRKREKLQGYNGSLFELTFNLPEELRSIENSQAVDKIPQAVALFQDVV